MNFLASLSGSPRPCSAMALYRAAPRLSHYFGHTWRRSAATQAAAHPLDDAPTAGPKGAKIAPVASPFIAVSADVSPDILAKRANPHWSPIFPSPPSRDPLDLTFENYQQAYRSKTTGEIVRALLVLNLCRSTWLVDHNLQVWTFGDLICMENSGRCVWFIELFLNEDVSCAMKSSHLIAWLSNWVCHTSSIDWLIGLLTDSWLIDWLVDWLVDWLIDWLIDWITTGFMSMSAATVIFAFQLIRFARRVLGKRLFTTLMKATFYGHFVGGEDPERLKPLVDRMRQFGVKSILDYSAEEDVATETAVEQEMKYGIQNILRDSSSRHLSIDI